MAVFVAECASSCGQRLWGHALEAPVLGRSMLMLQRAFLCACVWKGEPGYGRARDPGSAANVWLNLFCARLLVSSRNQAWSPGDAAARDGKLDPVIGRDEEIRRCIQILSRRTKNNPVVIGEPGVGKTAVAEGLAQRIVAGTYHCCGRTGQRERACACLRHARWDETC
eukprot:351965-Chlamydomonas_euryale.AAC.18